MAGVDSDLGVGVGVSIGVGIAALAGVDSDLGVGVGVSVGVGIAALAGVDSDLGVTRATSRPLKLCCEPTNQINPTIKISPKTASTTRGDGFCFVGPLL